jgi:uncharacterized protein (TIGR02444 family)
LAFLECDASELPVGLRSTLLCPVKESYKSLSQAVLTWQRVEVKRPEIVPANPEGSHPRDDPDFSLVLGGPLYQLYLRARLAQPPLDLVTRRVVGASLICWLPLLLLAAFAAAQSAVDPLSIRAIAEVESTVVAPAPATTTATAAPAEVAVLESRIGPWRDATVIPLRAVRRALKVPPALVAGPTAEVFRNKIKAVELEAERLQQEAMYALAQAQAEPPGRVAASSEAAARANVAAYQTMLGVTFSTPAVDTVLAAFITMHTGE